MKRFAWMATAALLSTMPAAALAQGPEKAALCFACHGPAGAKPIAPEYPVLAGQHANYLAKALHEYKAGARKNPVMTAQAATLSEQDIEDLSQFFSLQAGSLYTPSVHGAAQ